MLFLLFCSNVFCATAEMQGGPPVTPRDQQQGDLKVSSPPPSPKPLPKAQELMPIVMGMAIQELRDLSSKVKELIEQGKQFRKLREEILFECALHRVNQ
jgi:hypothetical protein